MAAEHDIEGHAFTDCAKNASFYGINVRSTTMCIIPLNVKGIGLSYAYDQVQ